ncbi:hypothetical protein HYV81_04460 [Candidatus Woesearchaeota archaeon]|nr:hypothetical protein [Candidatus Woesearchaeota archaeon]
MERLNPNVAAVALGTTAAGISLLCAVLVAVFPLGATVRVANMLFHSVDIGSIAVKNLSVIGIAAGMIVWFIVAAITGYLFAFIYNWLGSYGNR